MKIRTETVADRAECLEVVTAGFVEDDGLEPIQTNLLRELFVSDAYVPELSIVAVGDGVVVGHVITTRATIGGEPSLGLGPISVRPTLQGSGIGSALMDATIERATARGETTIVLLGDPDYYGRFGFVRADELGIDPVEDWGQHFMVRPLIDGPPPRGPFEFAQPFRNL